MTHGDPTQHFTPPDEPPARSPTERLPVPQRKSPGRWIAAVAALALLAGGAGGYLQATGAREVLVSVEVGPEGGQVAFGGGSMLVPPGALSEPVVISIRRTTVDRPVRLHRSEGSPVTYAPSELEVYVFEPADLVFQEDVTVTLPAPNNSTAALVDSPDGARVIRGRASAEGVVIVTRDFSFTS